MTTQSTPDTTYAIVSLPDAQQYVGNAGDENSALLDLAIAVISAKVDEFLFGPDYHVIETQYSDVVLPETARSRYLYLPGPLHVTAIAKLEQRAGKETWTTVPSDVYEVTCYGAWGYSYTFVHGYRLYRVTWTTGWPQASVPGTIREVVLEEIKRFMRAKPDTQSESVNGAGSLVRTYSELDPVSKQKLNAFRRMSL